jgi:peptidoglycan hydrolase-like protein with peptidoglycan-binding domain
MLPLAGCGLFERGPARPTSDTDLGAAGTGRAASRPAPSPAIAEAQRALKDIGFDPGSVDGVLGQQTRQAVRDFQRIKGLRVTGDLDHETREALGIRAEARPGQGGR